MSAPAVSSLNAQETGEVWLALLEISHSSFSTLRFVNNNEDITHGGNTYTAYPFKIVLSSESGEEISRASLEIDNIDRSIIQELRQIATAPTMTVKIVMASSPDTVEAGPFNFSLKDVKYNASTIKGTLGYEDILDEAWPSTLYTPQNHVALF